MALTPGQQLQKGKYTIEKELGRGRFGITYLAKRSDGQRRAIKILNPDVLATLTRPEQERVETKFWQEAVKLSKCSRIPHIVEIDTPFREGTVACLPMEYLDGNSLADRRERILLEDKALEYVRQIGEALVVVHQRDLIHCDIRPANIFLRIQGSEVDAVLADFGLALDVETELSRTRDKEYVDGFSPIELCVHGQAVGAYTDVYSLAATLYELLTGEIPISAKDRKVNAIELVSPRVKNLEISASTNNAILAGMALMPEKRPQSVQSWLEQLNLGKASGTPAKKPMNWQTNWMAVSAIAAVVGVIVMLIVGIPGWLPWLKADPAPTPSPKPIMQIAPKTTK
jgi:eukaryotic-like serine/threonine-protein kinase